MRLLLIEDDVDLRRVVATALEEEGYAVDVAADGEEGLHKALTWEYDALILDVMLPKLDGWEVLSKLREKKSVPVLMLTARDGVNDRVRGLDGGADDYLVKPFDLSELCARIRSLIRRSVGKPQAQFEIGDLVVDTVSKCVLKSGAPVPLTAKEYSMFEFLALRRGELVTRTMLYDHLFDEYDDSLSNLVDVYISNLRRKLGRELITTRRGQGYLIDD
ncbi:MAG: response regulator transcription factor [Planctomycetaceae bacterium]|nr:response regulator transcription factor [Planctomycetaceae bacterium]